MLMQKVTFRELWEVAVQLEVCAADLAASRNSRKLVDALREISRRWKRHSSAAATS